MLAIADLWPWRVIGLVHSTSVGWWNTIVKSQHGKKSLASTHSHYFACLKILRYFSLIVWFREVDAISHDLKGEYQYNNQARWHTPASHPTLKVEARWWAIPGHPQLCSMFVLGWIHSYPQPHATKSHTIYRHILLHKAWNLRWPNLPMLCYAERPRTVDLAMDCQ